jgi:hypothetical protein
MIRKPLKLWTIRITIQQTWAEDNRPDQKPDKHPGKR